jgi:hypothetical protein
MAEISEKDRGIRERGLPATIKFITPPRGGPQGVVRHGQKIWELEQDVLIEGNAPKNVAPRAPRSGTGPESGKAKRPLPAVQARPQYPAHTAIAPNAEQDARGTGNRYGQASQPTQVEPLAAFVADTETALSWLARVGTAEGVTGGTTVGGGAALSGGTGGGLIISGPLVLAGLAAIGAWGLAGYEWGRVFRESESAEEFRVNSGNLHESVRRAVHQLRQNEIITDEEYLNYLSTGVLVIQPRPLADAANRDIRGTNSINSAPSVEQAAQRGLAAGQPKATGPPKKQTKAGTVGSKAGPAPGTRIAKDVTSSGTDPLEPGRSELGQYGIDKYSTFSNRPNDKFAGHELVQNLWLEVKGYGKRLAGPASRNNPAIALTQAEHTAVGREQMKLGLFDRDKLAKMNATQVIEENAKAMKNAGIPDYVIETLKKEALKYAATLKPPAGGTP